MVFTRQVDNKMQSKGFGARVFAELAALAGFLSVLSAPAWSQAPFYQGKTISVLQSTQAGDTSDTMTRAVVPFLKKHIPGDPTIKFEFMPGGGGTKAANHIFSNVRPDGLTIGRIGGGLVANAVLRETGVLYDLNKLIYLGSSHSTYHWVFITRGEAGLKSLVALRSASGVRIGAQAVGHSNYFVRAAVRLSDRAQVAELRGRLFRQRTGYRVGQRRIGWPHQ
jgi:tripartite-type tricarboxylate transporter receptor subunit TctC